MFYYLVIWDGNTPVEIRIHYIGDSEAISYLYDSEFVDLLEKVTDTPHYRPVRFAQDYGDLWSHGCVKTSCTSCNTVVGDSQDLNRIKDSLLCNDCYNKLLE